MKDYNVLIKVRSARVIRAMRDMGFETVAELCRDSGANQSEVGAIINFKISPKNKNGSYKESVIKISKSLHRTPQELFPSKLYDKVSLKNALSCEFESGENPYTKSCDKELKEKVAFLLNSLPPRTKYILVKRHIEGKTYAEISKSINLSTFRISQIDQQALVKIRNSKQKLESLKGLI